MQKRRMRGSRRASVAALVLVAMGLVVMASSVASASVLLNHFPVIKFWSASSEVTLQLPQPACPVSRPGCEWTLLVDEPDVPAQTVVGMVSGTSGILTVAYPPDFCGVIQADAILGPDPTKLEVGHQVVVTTASGCPFMMSSSADLIAVVLRLNEPWATSVMLRLASARCTPSRPARPKASS